MKGAVDWTMVLISLIGASGPIVALLVTASIKRRDEIRAKEQLERDAAVAAKVEEVKESLETKGAATDKKLEGLAIVAEASNVFLNHEKADLLLAYANVLAKESKRTKNRGDREMAERAMSAYHSHIAAQRGVDRLPGTEAEKKGERPALGAVAGTAAPAATGDPVVVAEAEQAQELILKHTLSIAPKPEEEKGEEK